MWERSQREVREAQPIALQTFTLELRMRGMQPVLRELQAEGDTGPIFREFQSDGGAACPSGTLISSLERMQMRVQTRNEEHL